MIWINIGLYHDILLTFHMCREFTEYFVEDTFQCKKPKLYPQNCVLTRWWMKNQSNHEEIRACTTIQILVLLLENVCVTLYDSEYKFQ